MYIGEAYTPAHPGIIAQKWPQNKGNMAPYGRQEVKKCKNMHNMVEICIIYQKSSKSSD